MGIELNSIIGQNNGTDFQERKKAYQNERYVARKTGKLEYWPINTGRYKNGLTIATPEPVTVNGVELEGMEIVMHRQLMNVLEAKAKDQADTPAVALDFGGMFGISFLKLALAAQDLIRDGKVAFAVSNLDFDPSTLTEDEVKKPKKALGSTRYDKFFFQNKHLVHFIISDAEELKDKVLHLSNGRRLSLSGNIDLIHEHSAIGKSDFLETDLPMLGLTMSPYGILLLGGEALSVPKYGAYKSGISNLMQTGVRQMELGKDAYYKVFINQKSPLRSLAV